MATKGVFLDYDTADRIAICSLREHLGYLEKEVEDHETTGSWMHTEDYQQTKAVLIPALRAIIKYYGGESD